MYVVGEVRDFLPLWILAMASDLLEGVFDKHEKNESRELLHTSSDCRAGVDVTSGLLVRFIRQRLRLVKIPEEAIGRCTRHRRLDF